MAARPHPLPRPHVNGRELLARTMTNWGEDNVPRLAAAFSFYAVLSLSPVLVLGVVVAGMIFGEGTARQELLDQARSAVGPQGARLILELVDNARREGATTVATVLSLCVTFFSASNLFIALDESVNAIWNLPPSRSFVKHIVVSRITAFLCVAFFGLVVLGWLALDSWLGYLESQTRGFQGWQVVSFLVSVAFLTCVFAVALKQLPRHRVQWGDVWIGAAVTGFGFGLSKLLIGLYFAYAHVSAAYGSAGALVVILLWFYYSSQIFFFGVELTYSYAYYRGSLRDRDPVGLQRS